MYIQTINFFFVFVFFTVFIEKVMMNFKSYEINNQ